MNLRPYRPSDAPALAALCLASIRALGPAAYAPGEVEAWAAYPALTPEGLREFAARLARGTCFVADIDGRPAAFAQLDAPDHLDFLYCAPTHARRGVASALYARLEAEARARGAAELRTEASRVARPFFEKNGFVVVTTERVERAGMRIERFRMTKQLVPGAPMPAPESVEKRHPEGRSP